VIGVQPSQFVVLLAITNMMQSVQHANIRVHFGWLGERLLVSPTFHRRHHAIGFGHEGTTYGCNFGVLFPWWDMIFRSVSWNRELEPTGIRDQLPVAEAPGRDYGDGFIAQHLLAFKRIGERIRAHRGMRAPDSDSDAAAV
jgi:sterol desaturase/sphingolipid hydroxylase (fatty acid hydroxylase superfamily)